nr:zinc finger BED domain-containing protein RICESLEEPER 2-like [Ipomoea batatas]
MAGSSIRRSKRLRRNAPNGGGGGLALIGAVVWYSRFLCFGAGMVFRFVYSFRWLGVGCPTGGVGYRGWHDLLSVFFEDSGFPALYIKVIAMQPRRLRMSWRESKNNIDSGVFAMRHMETYVGQSIASWDCGIRSGDARCVREMRVKLMSDLLLFHNNTHRLPNVNAVGGFEATIR